MILRRLIVACALAFSATACALADRPREPAAATAFSSVIETERAFASMSVREGIKRSFLHYAAPDSIIFRPRPVPALATLNKDADDDDGLTLDWWPAFGAIAKSNDLALSVGPWVMRSKGGAPNGKALYGYYATIWRKQTDGSWKFVLDGAGARISGAPTRAKGSPISEIAPSASVSDLGACAALKAIRKVEERLSVRSEVSAREAIGREITPDSLLMGSTVEPTNGLAASRAELSRRPARMTLHYLGGGASNAGDLVYTYGTVESADAQVPMKDASYLHVWQRRAGVWRLIFQGIKSRPHA